MPETALEREPRGIGRPPKEMTLEYLTSAADFQRLLNATQNLTDEAYNDLIDDIGARAARLVLRAKACQGDVPALKLYLQVCQDAKKAKREASQEPTRQVISSEFGRRSTTE